jgi:hypothetical protein
MLESLKILLVCTIAAIGYGVIHDQFTTRICIEYFTVFHPRIFASQSPTVLAIGWGILATWWVGTALGLLLTIAARIGSRRKLAARHLLRPIGKLLLFMAACAALFGFAGFVLTEREVISPPQWVALTLPHSVYSRFMADWWAHNASYASGIMGGLGLCMLTYRRRNSGSV